MTDHSATVVLIAHGSRADAANDAHRTTCAELSERIDRRVLPAFLELAEPTIGAAIASAADAGATSVLVVPYFLLPGNHTARDIPALVDDARRHHPGLRIDLSSYVGAEPAMLDVVADVITRGLP